MTLDVSRFQQGAKYRIQYQIPGLHRATREAVMRFTCTRDGGGTLVFDARPNAGTQEVRPDWVKAVWRVDPNTHTYVDRIVYPEERVY